MSNFKYIFSIIVIVQILLLFQSANTLAGEKCLKSEYQIELTHSSNSPLYLNNLSILTSKNSNPTNNTIFIEAEEQIPDEKIITNYFSSIHIAEFKYKTIFNKDLSVFPEDFGFINYNKLLGRFIRD